MKSAVLPTLLFLLLVSFLVTIQGQQPRYCQQTFTPGKPGTCPGNSCLLDALAKYGASAMPKNCTCNPVGTSSRTCTCYIVC